MSSSSILMNVRQSSFGRIASPENLFAAWEKFRKGKGSRPDVLRYERDVEKNIFQLQRELQAGTYRHGPYSAFTMCDPKQRRIHKATVRDRIVHHAVFAVLNPIFEPAFIAHSFSCRVGKGTHRAVDALERMLRRVSRNGTRPCFALKCDVRQFFASVRHDTLLHILGRRIADERTLLLLAEIIGSFPSPQARIGIPIGNLTSQLFANVYLNELDSFVKHRLRVRHYIRYTDDFVMIAESAEYLQSLLHPIEEFLRSALQLTLHPHKVTIRKYRQGIDFLGYVSLPCYRVLRTVTRKRMFRKLQSRVGDYRNGNIGIASVEQSLQSYLGVLSHADAFHLSEELQNQCWYWLVG
ncbi:MAG: reverse transcriptase/maturase family protein [Candidatus Peregrinibacteria bacterium]